MGSRCEPEQKKAENKVQQQPRGGSRFAAQANNDIDDEGSDEEFKNFVNKPVAKVSEK